MKYLVLIAVLFVTGCKKDSVDPNPVGCISGIEKAHPQNGRQQLACDHKNHLALHQGASGEGTYYSDIQWNACADCK